MQLEWIYDPIAQYTVMGLGLIACLVLWVSAKAEIRSVRRGLRNALEQIESGATTLRASISDVKTPQSTVVELPVAPATGPIAPFLPGLNLTKRSQILRMKRRGEGPHSIAAALQVPVGEVSLILKMESLQAPAPAAASEAKVVPMIARGAARGIL